MSDNSDIVAQYALDILHLKLKTATSTLVFPDPHETKPQPPDAEQTEETDEDIRADIKDLEVKNRRLKRGKDMKTKLQDLLRRETEWTENLRLEMVAEQQKVSGYQETIQELQKRPTVEQWQQSRNTITTLTQRPTQEAVRHAITAATDPIQTALNTKTQECDELRKRPTVEQWQQARNTITTLTQRPTQEAQQLAITAATDPIQTALNTKTEDCNELRKRPTHSELTEAVTEAKRQLQTVIDELSNRPTRQDLADAIVEAELPLKKKIRGLEKQPIGRDLADDTAEDPEISEEQTKENQYGLQRIIQDLKSRLKQAKQKTKTTRPGTVKCRLSKRILKRDYKGS